MQKSKAALFLMELLIVLLFFSIASAVCIQLFSYAHLTNKSSKAYSDANVIFTNHAEDFYSSEQLSVCSNVCIYYDSSLNETTANMAEYKAAITISNSEDIWDCHISVFDCEKEHEYISEDLTRYERRTLEHE